MYTLFKLVTFIFYFFHLEINQYVFLWLETMNFYVEYMELQEQMVINRKFVIDSTFSFDEKVLWHLSELFLLGRQPCLFCHITKEEMQIFPAERGIITSHSLETLTSDLIKFRADGSNIKNAKYFNNVINNVLLAVPIDQVFYIFKSKHASFCLN